MKSIMFFCLPLFFFCSCKEQTNSTTEAKSDTLAVSTPPTTTIDTVIGIVGTEKAKFNGTMFSYTSAQVKLMNNNNSQVIEVNGTVLPNQEGDFFGGIYKNYLFIDHGTGTNGRSLKIWSIDEKKVILDTPYEGELSIKEDKLNFIQPIDITKTKQAKPKCPDAEKWAKDGFSIGYGVPSAYDFVKNTVVVMGETTCFMLQ